MTHPASSVDDSRAAPLPHVIIIGGGFAGLAAARALDGAPARVTLLDRRNHHVFQPLLYQVATAALSPADISAPIRHILRKQANCRVALAEVTSIDPGAKTITVGGGAGGGSGRGPTVTVPYDDLILAAGATHSYFGHEDWSKAAPGLKSLEDAIEIRRRILLAFESAEYEGSDEERRAALTFAIVGGGPTGVELAGAIKEIAAKTIPADFKRIDTKTARVLILQGADRLLEAFPPDLSDRAKRDLESMGVEVRLKCRVTDVFPDGIEINGSGAGGDGERLAVRNVFWAAGVKANPLTNSLVAAGVALDRSGRVPVLADLTISGHPELFVVGDVALARSGGEGGPVVPGVAQGGIQMGHYAGSTIARELAAKARHRSPPARTPFVYHDKGTLATIGRARAVADIKGFHVAGLLAWLLWGAIHVTFLIGFRNRVAVLLSWLWNWLIFSRDARLITGDASVQIRQPLGPEAGAQNAIKR
jgi:NADH dehydrogenase